MSSNQAEPGSNDKVSDMPKCGEDTPASVEQLDTENGNFV